MRRGSPTLELREPATGAPLGALPLSSAADVRAAAAVAAGPQPLWALISPRNRSRYLRRAAQALLDELEPLADLLARESGIPRTEALLAELLPSVGALHALADDGPRAIRARRVGRVPLLRAGRRATLLHAPAGVMGIAASDASPFNEVMLETAAALLGGNGVVLAPAAGLAAERVRAVLVRAGIPAELVQVVHGGEAAAALPEACDAVVAAEPAGPRGTMLVLAGAPVGRTVGGALWAAFAGAGQSPAAVGLAVVLRSQAGALAERLEQRARGLRVGDPRLAETEVGPVRSPERAGAVAELLDDAVARGARLLCGGPTTVAGLSGPFVAPAVLRGVPAGARLLEEPVPGPVLALVEADGEDEAIAIAREARGAVSVWSGDRGHGERIARTLPAELTWVNEHGFTAPAAAVRVGRHVEIRQLASHPLRLRTTRWLPYDPALVRASTAVSRLRHGRESERVATLRTGAVPLARITARMAREILRR